MTIRIGVNPITWSDDDMPELGGDAEAGSLPHATMGHRDLAGSLSGAGLR